MKCFAMPACTAYFLFQGIKSGTLSPRAFGVFNLQDAVYCHKVLEFQRIAARKAKREVKAFLDKNVLAYNEYSGRLLQSWRIGSPEAIDLSKSLSE